MSQNFDIDLSFCFIVCRRWKLGKKYKQTQKLPVFCHKIKTKALTKKSEKNGYKFALIKISGIMPFNEERIRHFF